MALATDQPGKFWAYIAVGAGGLLILGGFVTLFGFLGLPLVGIGDDILGAQLGQIAGIFLGLGVGTLSFFHGLTSILNRRSSSFRLAPPFVYYLIFAIALGLGNVVLNFEIVEEFLFPPIFLLGALLPTAAVLAWALRRLGWPITWRQGALALVAGSTISVFLAILLETFLPFITYLLLFPLEELAFTLSDSLAFGAPGFLERLFLSPAILVFLLFTAFEAPIPEEFAKVLGVTFFGRRRIANERQAFALGLCAGAGFAILENMLYEGLYAQWSGWSWGGVTLLRGIGSVLHPLGTAIVALGWFRWRKGGFRELLKAYGISVGIHTLWNGGFLPFVYLSGLELVSGAETTLSIYGEAIEALLVVFLVMLSIGLWWLLRRFINDMAQEVEPDFTTWSISPRALAVWGLVSLIVIVPIGVAVGPAWSQIQSVIFGSP